MEIKNYFAQQNNSIKIQSKCQIDECWVEASRFVVVSVTLGGAAFDQNKDRDKGKTAAPCFCNNDKTITAWAERWPHAFTPSSILLFIKSRASAGSHWLKLPTKPIQVFCSRLNFHQSQSRSLHSPAWVDQIHNCGRQNAETVWGAQTVWPLELDLFLLRGIHSGRSLQVFSMDFRTSHPRRWPRWQHLHHFRHQNLKKQLLPKVSQV